VHRCLGKLRPAPSELSHLGIFVGVLSLCLLWLGLALGIAVPVRAMTSPAAIPSAVSGGWEALPTSSVAPVVPSLAECVVDRCREVCPVDDGVRFGLRPWEEILLAAVEIAESDEIYTYLSWRPALSGAEVECGAALRYGSRFRAECRRPSIWSRAPPLR
jgi:hypothetical protein